MRVLNVCHSDLEGGAARAAHRLHRSLLRAGVDAGMFVQVRRSNDPRIAGPMTGWAKAKALVRPRLDQLWASRYGPVREGRKLFSPAMLPFGDLVPFIRDSDADVVHLHWIAGGMVRTSQLAQITKPIVWSLHDMWPFTGGCHYDEECGRWRSQCGKCPVLGSGSPDDLSRKVLAMKRRTYAALPHLTVVGLSRWMAELATESTVFQGHRVVNLPNPIDTEAFKPVDHQEARRILGLPIDKRLILFGAVKATADPRKGFLELQQALKALPKGEIELVVLGADRPENGPDLGHPVHYLGELHDDPSLCVLYNAADVTVVPSLQENLSNTIVESLACGTPVVAFDIGGNSDMVEHHGNGALAIPRDPGSLATCLRWVLEHPAPSELADASRRTALEKFAMDLVAAKYVQLYREVVQAHGHQGG